MPASESASCSRSISPSATGSASGSASATELESESAVDKPPVHSALYQLAIQDYHGEITENEIASSLTAAIKSDLSDYSNPISETSETSKKRKKRKKNVSFLNSGISFYSDKIIKTSNIISKLSPEKKSEAFKLFFNIFYNTILQTETYEFDLNIDYTLDENNPLQNLNKELIGRPLSDTITLRPRL